MYETPGHINKKAYAMLVTTDIGIIIDEEFIKHSLSPAGNPVTFFDLDTFVAAQKRFPLNLPPKENWRLRASRYNIKS